MQLLWLEMREQCSEMSMSYVCNGGRSLEWSVLGDLASINTTYAFRIFLLCQTRQN